MSDYSDDFSEEIDEEVSDESPKINNKQTLASNNINTSGNGSAALKLPKVNSSSGLNSAGKTRQAVALKPINRVQSREKDTSYDGGIAKPYEVTPRQKQRRDSAGSNKDPSFHYSKMTVTKSIPVIRSSNKKVEVRNSHNSILEQNYVDEYSDLFTSGVDGKNDYQVEKENLQLRKALKELSANLDKIIAKTDVTDFLPKKPIEFKNKPVQDQLRTINKEMQNNHKIMDNTVDEYEKLRIRLDQLQDPLYMMNLKDQIEATKRKSHQVNKANKQMDAKTGIKAKRLNEIENVNGVSPIIQEANSKEVELTILARKTRKVTEKNANLELEREEKTQKLYHWEERYNKLLTISKHLHIGPNALKRQDKYDKLRKNVATAIQDVQYAENAHDKFIDNGIIRELEDLTTDNQRSREHIEKLSQMVEQQRNALKEMLEKEDEKADVGMKEIITKLKISLENDKRNTKTIEEALGNNNSQHHQQPRRQKDKPPLAQKPKADEYGDLPVFSPTKILKRNDSAKKRISVKKSDFTSLDRNLSPSNFSNPSNFRSGTPTGGNKNSSSLQKLKSLRKNQGSNQKSADYRTLDAPSSSKRRYQTGGKDSLSPDRKDSKTLQLSDRKGGQNHNHDEESKASNRYSNRQRVDEPQEESKGLTTQPDPEEKPKDKPNTYSKPNLFKKPFSSKKNKDSGSPERNQSTVNYDSNVYGSNNISRTEDQRKDNETLGTKDNVLTSIDAQSYGGISDSNKLVMPGKDNFGTKDSGAGGLRLSEEFQPKKSQLTLSNELTLENGNKNNKQSPLKTEQQQLTLDDTKSGGTSNAFQIKSRRNKGGLDNAVGGESNNLGGGTLGLQGNSLGGPVSSVKKDDGGIIDPFAKFDNLDELSTSTKGLKLPDNLSSQAKPSPEKKPPRKHDDGASQQATNLDMGFGLFNPVDDDKRAVVGGSNNNNAAKNDNKPAQTQQSQQQQPALSKKFTMAVDDDQGSVFDTKVQVRKGPRNRGNLGSGVTGLGSDFLGGGGDDKKAKNDPFGGTENELKLSDGNFGKKKDDIGGIGGVNTNNQNKDNVNNNPFGGGDDDDFIKELTGNVKPGLQQNGGISTFAAQGGGIGNKPKKAINAFQPSSDSLFGDDNKFGGGAAGKGGAFGGKENDPFKKDDKDLFGGGGDAFGSKPSGGGIGGNAFENKPSSKNQLGNAFGGNNDDNDFVSALTSNDKPKATDPFKKNDDDLFGGGGATNADKPKFSLLGGESNNVGSIGSKPKQMKMGTGLGQNKGQGQEKELALKAEQNAGGGFFGDEWDI